MDLDRLLVLLFVDHVSGPFELANLVIKVTVSILSVGVIQFGKAYNSLI